jgi:hypothetical protein
LHAGNLPGYPASHGCVRLPLDFAQKLYTVTDKGTTVVVTDGKTKTGTTSRPGLLFARGPTPTLAPGQFVWTPEKSPEGPVSILFSSADSQAYVYRNGVEIGRAQIGGVDATFPSGSYAYAALAITLTDGSRQWQALGSASGSPAPDLKALEKRLVIPQSLYTHDQHNREPLDGANPRKSEAGNGIPVVERKLFENNHLKVGIPARGGT